MYWLVLVSLTQSKVTWQKRISIKEFPPLVGPWWCRPLIPALRRPRQVDLCEIKASLVGIVSCSPAGITNRTCLLKNKNFLYQISLWPYLWGIFWIVSWYRRVQPTVGNAVPRQMGLVKSGEASLYAAFLHDLCFSYYFQAPASSSCLTSLDDKLWLIS